MAKGFITKVNSGNYSVYDGINTYVCRARGKFRIGNYSPLVGDIVTFDEKELYLLDIEKRKNSLLRPPLANVEQIAIIASATNPEIALSLINRFIVIAEMISVRPIIVFTKVDIDESKKYLEKKHILESMGYKCYEYSSKTLEGLESIKSLFKDKKTVFMGQSGVGKSTLINFLVPGSRQKTGEISKALGRGKHVTRVVEYLKYCDGFIADTPGFSSIDFELEPVDLAAYYPGFEKYYPSCKFRNCLHKHEKGCAVKEATESGIIDKDYYQSYLDLLDEIMLGKEKGK